MSERASGKTIDLRDLESLVGVKYEREEERKRVILPADRWSHVNERVDAVRRTRLMIASRDGARECVNLLLRCGSDVNARDRHKRQAIDYSVDGNHLEVTLMLLQWDSLLPSMNETEINEKLVDVLFQNDDIKQFFNAREEFHESMKYHNPESLKKYLEAFEGDYNTPRYWVNSRGESSLYTAAKKNYYDSWALLRSSGFSCATEDEEEYVKLCENQDAFLRAIGRHFVEIRGCHVQKMVAKSKVYRREGVDEERCGEKVDGYFREIDAVECTSDLLQSLQDDPSLEIVFDFSSTDIQCMKPLDVPVKEAWGLVDFQLNRIYVGAMETEEFDYSRLVSNIVHEMTHKTLAVVFDNGGLPYHKEDTDAQEEYGNVIKNLLSALNKRIFDDILGRALKIGGSIEHELIVRVPEMISKYNILCNENKSAENGFDRLKSEAPELLHFYLNRVVPRIKGHIRSNLTANKAVKGDLLSTPALLTAHYNERIQVVDTLHKFRPSMQKDLRILHVSNLKLAVSHLKSSLEEVTFVDWTKYQSAREHFNAALDRNEIKTLAIVWDEPKKPFLCHGSKSTLFCDSECLSKKIASVVDVAMVIIPSKFNSRSRGKNSLGYAWKDLSPSTKEWIMVKNLCFNGKWMSLRDIVGCISGNDEPELLLDQFLDEDDVSMLIDQDNIKIGRPLTSNPVGKGFELLKQNPNCYIPRSLMVRHMEFSQEVFKSRTSDVFIVMNADKSDIERNDIYEACTWDGNNVPVGIRCFTIIAQGHQEIIYDKIREMISKLVNFASVKSKWDFIHFFELKDDKYIHLNSFHCGARQILSNSTPQKDLFHYSGISILEGSKIGTALIISDSPGSGKSVYVQNTAVQITKGNPRCWVQNVELPLFEGVLKEWNASDLRCAEKGKDCLYAILKAAVSDREKSFERKIFNLFCDAKKGFLIFFDGFDEICPRYKEVFTSFVEVVVRGTSSVVCIATREHESAELEKRLATISFSFRPFSVEDQVKCISVQWNALLNSMPKGEREGKIKAIRSHLESQDTPTDKDELLTQFQNLSRKKVGSGTLKVVNFEVLAKELLKVGKSTVEGEGDLTATPLHTWMLATVYFEDNLNFKKLMNLPDLYTRFIEIKISLYCEEKARLSGNVASDSLVAGIKLSVQESLMRFSAYFFLEDDDCRLNQDEIFHMLRVGLLAQRDQSTVFVHRTFGEYFFSRWLLEKAHKKKVTRVWVHRILVDNEFQKVRSFLNSLLLSEYGKESARGEKGRAELGRCSLNPSSLPAGEQFVTSMQKCVFRSVLECTSGVLRYLAENSKAEFADVMFGEAGWNVTNLGIDFGWSCRIARWNAFILCGECISNGAVSKKSNVTLSGMEYLKFLPKMLRMVEERGAVANLKDFMSGRDLRWMGVEMKQHWKQGEGRERFKCIFEFVVRNESVLGGTMKAKLLEEENGLLLVNTAIHSFDLFAYILESLFEEGELKESLLIERNFARAWTSVFEESGLEEVKNVWGFVEGKLKANEERARFLQSKDYEEKNALFSSFLQSCDRNVVSFLWGLLKKEFDVGACKELLLDTFSRVKLEGYEFHHHIFFQWFFKLYEDGFYNEDDAIRLLFSRDRGDKLYMLRFGTNPLHPMLLRKFQELLLGGRRGTEDIVREMEGHYMWLAIMCFSQTNHISWDADFISSVEREWEELIPSLESFPLWNSIQLDEGGSFPQLMDVEMNSVFGVGLKAFVVLLDRQCRAEVPTLGSEGLLERVKGQWFRFCNHLPKAILREDESVERGDFFVYPLFAVFSKFLRRERAADLLLVQDARHGTGVHLALKLNGPSCFLALYDVVRWSAGEDALWMVHAAGGGAGEVEGDTILETLMRGQEEGLFEFLKRYPPSGSTVTVAGSVSSP